VRIHGNLQGNEGKEELEDQLFPKTKSVYSFPTTPIPYIDIDPLFPCTF